MPLSIRVDVGKVRHLRAPAAASDRALLAGRVREQDRICLASTGGSQRHKSAIVRATNAVDPPERRLPESIVKQVASDGVGEQPSLQGQRDPVGVALNQAPGDEVRQAGPFADA
jgi:hypothetical protein